MVRPPTADEIRRAPKVLLHDHLDGGLRVPTIVELAREQGYRELPTTDVDELRSWFGRGAHHRDLTRYLEPFVHTVGVMQSKDAIERVAAECAIDLAADGVVYAEVRVAPELHLRCGLTLDEVVDAAVRGFDAGCSGRDIRIGVICTAIRTAERSLDIAQLAVRHRHEGVVGFDIAGAEHGFPPTRHIDAFEYLKRANFHCTVHAGEAFGPPSIWEAIQHCGAERLGHGVRICDDITVDPDGTARLGSLAAYVRDRRIPLEICPSSNIHTGVASTLAEHPVGLLRDLRFRITINTDNRLMSSCTMTSEMHALVDTFGWDLTDVEWLTANAMKSAFIPFDERIAILDSLITPRYAALKREG
jgi:adenosine deaminase